MCGNRIGFDSFDYTMSRFSIIADSTTMLEMFCSRPCEWNSSAWWNGTINTTSYSRRSNSQAFTNRSSCSRSSEEEQDGNSGGIGYKGESYSAIWDFIGRQVGQIDRDGVFWSLCCYVGGEDKVRGGGGGTRINRFWNKSATTHITMDDYLLTLRNNQSSNAVDWRRTQFRRSFKSRINYVSLFVAVVTFHIPVGKQLRTSEVYFYCFC